MLTIGDKSFTVHPLAPSTEARWLAYCAKLADGLGNPLKQFVDKYCEGLSDKDRECAIKGRLATPGWDAPSEDTLKECRDSLPSAWLLAFYCLDPQPTWEECKILITDENKKDLWEAIRRVANPTDGEIREANAALRERLKKAADQGGE